MGDHMPGDRKVVAVQPVCITGMHRSGTSMVARILSTCGLWLGPEDRLMPAKPDNPDGFFENLDLVRINDELIERHGGGWDAPPALGPGWEQAALASELRPGALAWAAPMQAGVAGTAGARGWGWKDPRSCLTQPFWRALFPGQKTVVCLRNPTAVARSLRMRGNYSLHFGLRLWQAYNRPLLASLAPGSYTVTHYDAWFVDPDAELQRVLGFLQWEVPAEVRHQAAAFVKRSFRHHEGESLDMLLSVAGLETAALYDRLRAQAGEGYARSPEGVHRPRTDGAGLPEPAAQPDLDGSHANMLRLELALQRQRNAELAAALDGHARRVAWYRTGDPIDFRRGGNAPLYATTGWTDAAPTGTWSVGSTMQLQLRPTPAGAGAFKLSARLRPLVAAAQPTVTVEVLANGVRQAKWELTEATLQTVEATLQVDGFTEGDELVIRFEVAEPRSPFELGLSADVRKIVLFVHQIRLESA